MTPLVLTLPYFVEVWNAKEGRMSRVCGASANTYWRTRVCGNFVTTYLSESAKEFKRQVELIARAAGCTEPIKGRVELEWWVFPPRPKDWAKRKERDEWWDDDLRCVDGDNVLKVLLDSLKNIAFEDDKRVRTYHGELCEPDEHGARLVVRISEWSGEKAPSLLP